MVSMSATIDAGNVAKFSSALQNFAAVLGKQTATAPRRAAIQICKSFRAASGTLKAPKYARSSEYTIAKSDTTPKYITKNGVAMRRWHVVRHVRDGKPEFDVFAEKKREVRLKRLLLAHAGLARQSWGWVMHNIFSGAAPDTPWQRRKKDRRNPKDATRESTSSSQSTPTFAQGFARICNRIDYIGAALKISVDQAVDKAANWMAHEAKRRAAKL